MANEMKICDSNGYTLRALKKDGEIHVQWLLNDKPNHQPLKVDLKEAKEIFQMLAAYSEMP
jgi:hypothetical protein